MRGSIKDFEFGADLVFDIGKRDGRNVLDLAVLVRRSSDHQSRLSDPAFLRPPPGATSGGGGTVGSFTLQFWLPQRELWVNGVCLLTLAAQDNVVLLDEQAGALAVIGTEHVSMDFESVPVPLGSRDPSPLDVWSVLLRQAFSRSARVASFLASSAHPSLVPLANYKNIRGRDFAPHIDAWYCIQVIKERPQLQCAVLVRLSDASRAIVTEPVWRRTPPFTGRASGASFGPYDVLYDIERRDIWVGGTVCTPAAGANVYLFRERGSVLELVGTLTIDPDLRASPKWRETVLGSPACRELSA